MKKDPKGTLDLRVHPVTKATEAHREDLENRVPLDRTAHEVHLDPWEKREIEGLTAWLE